MSIDELKSELRTWSDAWGGDKYEIADADKFVDVLQRGDDYGILDAHSFAELEIPLSDFMDDHEHDELRKMGVSITYF